MTIKELEILASDENLLDLLTFARCQLLNLHYTQGIPQYRNDQSLVRDTLYEIRDTVEKKKPNFECQARYRR